MNQISFPNDPILLVDDEKQLLLSVEFTLSSNGIDNVISCQDSRKVMPLLSQKGISLIIMDMIMPHLPGWELLPMLTQEYPDVPVIVLTAMNEVEHAVTSMKDGAFDYLVKPIDDDRLISVVRKTIELNNMRQENRLLKKYLLSDILEYPDAFLEIITNHVTMRAIFQYIEAIADSPLPVLITGETGVGKELIATAIHRISKQPGEFIPVNIAGVDDHLFSDTLFGHKKGAFTGADRDRKGLIEQANHGTIFLDEIGDLGMESQVKLLRLLQEGKYYPIGADIPRLSTARAVVATNTDLEEAQKYTKFRKDLYYRLQTHHIHVPPLRERKTDIPLLASHFLEKSAKTLNKKQPTPPRELITLLNNYHFPGNIRELEGMIFDAVSRHKSGVLSLDSFREKIIPLSAEGDRHPFRILSIDPGETNEEIKFPQKLPTLKELEQKLILEALQRSDGNQTIAAQILGLSRRALNNRLSRGKKPL